MKHRLGLERWSCFTWLSADFPFLKKKVQDRGSATGWIPGNCLARRVSPKDHLINWSTATTTTTWIQVQFIDCYAQESTMTPLESLGRNPHATFSHRKNALILSTSNVDEWLLLLMCLNFSLSVREGGKIQEIQWNSPRALGLWTIDSSIHASIFVFDYLNVLTPFHALKDTKSTLTVCIQFALIYWFSIQESP